MLDVHRALLDARAAHRAGPQHVGIDYAIFCGGADQRTLVSGHREDVEALERVRVADFLAHAVLAAAGLQVGRLLIHVVAQTHDHQFRRQRLSGVPRGTLRLAAPTLGAGREVEQALPGEVLDLGDAEQVCLWICLLEVEFLAVAHHRSRRAEGISAVGIALEEDVEEGPQAVPADAHRGLARQHEEERPGRHDLDERDEADEYAGSRPVDADRLPEVGEEV